MAVEVKEILTEYDWGLCDQCGRRGPIYLEYEVSKDDKGHEVRQYKRALCQDCSEH